MVSKTLQRRRGGAGEFVRELISHSGKGQVGFTLIETIIMLGIIVLLAAVVIPNVHQFAGKGDDGAKKTEWKSVQTALDAMMAQQVIVGVTGLTSSDNSVNSWSALPGGANTLPLSGYLQASPTAYYYCYNSSGLVTRQDETSTACP